MNDNKTAEVLFNILCTTFVIFMILIQISR